MLATVAVILPVFPTRSLKVNVYVPFPVNVRVYAFTPVIASLRPVKVTVTSPLVAPVVEYFILAVGFVVSTVLMLATVAVALPRCPDKSWK